MIGIPSRSDETSGARIAGLTAGRQAERLARRRRNLAMVALLAPLTLLLSAAYLRFYDFVARILPGFFSVLFPAVLVALIAGLVYFMVDRAAAGDHLGARIRGATRADQEIVNRDDDLHLRAQELVAERDDLITAARLHLARAESAVEQRLHAADRARGHAAAVLNIPSRLPALTASDVAIGPWRHREQVIAGIERETARGARFDAAAQTTSLQPIAPLHTPWAVHRPSPHEVDLDAFPHPNVDLDREQPENQDEMRRRVIIIVLLSTITAATLTAVSMWLWIWP